MIIEVSGLLPLFFEESKTINSDIWGKQISFTCGEKIHITAPSGSGKTTLMHYIYGLRHDYNGALKIFSKKLSAYTPEEMSELRRCRISIVFQDLRLFPELTIRENLEVKRLLHPSIPLSLIEEMTDRLGISNRLDKPAKICSMGEQQRTAIIRSLLQPFEILLLDEPFSHLDDENCRLSAQLIQEVAEKQNACIIYADVKTTSFFENQQLLRL
ncbi:MAG: ATP-binding cassette domain-containing protein [Chitinophagaceae bacterium]|nr:ATP-binding cassette domain-containing protein [Chitinophagaceae bacterium]